MSGLRSLGARDGRRSDRVGAGSLGRIVLLSLALGLSVAAVIAIVGVLTQAFDNTDWRLIGTSLGFSLCSALGAAGSRARQRRGALAALGTSTVLGAGASFALLLVVIWNDGPGPLTRACAVVGLATLAASHACLVLASRRPSDTGLSMGLIVASVTAGSFDAVLGIVAITGAVERVGTGYERALAVLVIVLLFSTALPPILRRLGRGRPSGRASAAGLGAPREVVASAELDAIALALEELVPEAGPLGWRLQTDAAEIRRISRALSDARTRL